VRAAGGSGPRLNPIHVDDAAAAFMAALDAERPVTANIAGADVTNIREIAELIAASIGREACFDGSGAEPGGFVADIGRMRQELCAPIIPLARGLAEAASVVGRRS
jgi:nucleoside-diphosphate-sugar epimerase